MRWIAITAAAALALNAGSAVGRNSQLPTLNNPSISNGIEAYHTSTGTVEVDKTGKGAVLCMWGILEAVRAAGRECFAGKDQAFQAELDNSMKRIDAFILKNSSHHPTAASLSARRAEGVKLIHAHGSICTGDVASMYKLMRDAGGEKLRRQTTELLSIPREPVMNPCL